MTSISTLGTIQVGDVVSSERFVYGGYDSHGAAKPPRVGLSEPYAVWVSASTNPLRQTGRRSWLNNVETLQYDGSDETRRDALFVVIAVEHEDGPGGHVSYPNKITIQRLATDGSFDANGEKLYFYTSGGFMDEIREVNFLRRMKMIFVPITESV